MSVMTKERSLSHAASALDISPASLCKQLYALEEFIGIPLFEHGKRPLRPTLFGIIIADCFESLSRAYKSCSGQIRNSVYPASPASSRTDGVIVLNFQSQSIRLELLNLISEYLEVHPTTDIRLHLITDITKLCTGLIVADSWANRTSALGHFAPQYYDLLVPVGMPIRDSSYMEDRRSSRYGLCIPNNPILHEKINNYLASKKLTFDITLCDNAISTAAYVMKGLGIGIIHSDSFREFMPIDLKIVPIKPRLAITPGLFSARPEALSDEEISFIMFLVNKGTLTLNPALDIKLNTKAKSAPNGTKHS